MTNTPPYLDPLQFGPLLTQTAIFDAVDFAYAELGLDHADDARQTYAESGNQYAGTNMHLAAFLYAAQRHWDRLEKRKRGIYERPCSM